MTRHRGYKEKTSKFGVVDNLVEQIIEEVERPKVYGYVKVDHMVVRENQQGMVIEVLEKNDKVEILDTLDSKWVQVSTPSGRIGVAGIANIEEDVTTCR